jgi:NADP-dependent aldehyde dehydrogenase
MPAALEARAADLGRAFVGSLTMGSGQFCTNPGLLLAVDGDDLRTFEAAAAETLGAHAPQPMLTGAITRAYAEATATLAGHTAVTELAAGLEGDGVARAMARLFATDAASFLADRTLGHEVFGASSLVVRCHDLEELAEVLRHLEGQLAATLHMDAADEADAAKLVPIMEKRAGRILVNGWPTGVEVAHAMVHGGPHPATSNCRYTSVGSLAINRFLRPVCYQNLPASLLPTELRDGADGPRLLDGRRT